MVISSLIGMSGQSRNLSCSRWSNPSKVKGNGDVTHYWRAPVEIYQPNIQA